ncbi:MAG: tetraacyldisaccharide 4'-kinase [Bacteroidia bacterium]
MDFLLISFYLHVHQAVKYLLWPFSLLYGGMMWLRNLAFDIGIFRSKKYDVTTVVVGNIRVGGTGKTPMIAHLIQALKEDYNVAVLSRGYGRKTKGFYWVHTFDKAEKVGDEPLMLKQRFEGTLVAVCENRREGIERILYEQPLVNVILMDDAFQHRWVKARLSILLTTYDKPFFKDHPFPMGMLREFRRGYKRADAVVVTKCPEEYSSEDFRSYLRSKPLFFSHLDYVQLTHKDIYGFSGIAESELFKRHLSDNYNLQGFKDYGDHYDYSQSDLNYLIQQAGGSTLVCTRKDMVKMENFDGSDQIEVLDVDMDFDSDNEFIYWVRNQIDK